MPDPTRAGLGADVSDRVAHSSRHVLVEIVVVEVGDRVVDLDHEAAFVGLAGPHVDGPGEPPLGVAQQLVRCGSGPAGGSGDDGVGGLLGLGPDGEGLLLGLHDLPSGAVGRGARRISGVSAAPRGRVDDLRRVEARVPEDLDGLRPCPPDDLRRFVRQARTLFVGVAIFHGGKLHLTGGGFRDAGTRQ